MICIVDDMRSYAESVGIYLTRILKEKGKIPSDYEFDWRRVHDEEDEHVCVVNYGQARQH